uniref:Phytocyanin domain-containing protein n=1 Tax=Kalanchoe fedtschenkoi TaxID=63787 RepID=A0A7N0SX88_KALFE
MARCHSLVAVSILLVALVPATSMAKEFIVGDDAGWTIGFNYQAWAQGKEFRVGDTLVFKYPEGAHNVYKVNGSDFQACTPPSDSIPLTSGNDHILLATAGRKWYLCGVGEHCEIGGQKLVITVQPQLQSEAPSLAPSPWSQSMNAYYSNSVEKMSSIPAMAVASLAATLVTLTF